MCKYCKMNKTYHVFPATFAMCGLLKACMYTYLYLCAWFHLSQKDYFQYIKLRVDTSHSVVRYLI